MGQTRTDTKKKSKKNAFTLTITHACTNMYKYTDARFIYNRAYTRPCIKTSIHLYTRTCDYTNKLKYVNVPTYMHTYAHTYIHPSIHIKKNTHIFVQLQSKGSDKGSGKGNAGVDCQGGAARIRRRRSETVYTSTCTYLCTHGCIFVQTSECMYVCVYVCMYAQIYVCMYICM